MAERASCVHRGGSASASTWDAEAPPNSAVCAFAPPELEIQTASGINGAIRTAAPAGRVLAQFMERRGRRILQGCGALWHSVEAGILISCPYHLRLAPDPEDLRTFLRATKAPALRFPSLTWEGVPSGLYLFRRKRYGLGCIHPSYRQKVRKGTRKLQVRDLDPAELRAQGLQLNLDTLARQRRFDPELGRAEGWDRVVRALRNTPGISAIGVFLDGSLSAYMILCCEGGGLHIVHQMSRTEHLPYHPNHVLTFEVTRRASEDPNLDFVSYGLESLVHNPGLHSYKLEFGYEFARHNSVVAFHPRLAFLTSGAARAVVRTLRKGRPQDQRLERVESVLRTAAVSRPGDGGRRVVI